MTEDMTTWSVGSLIEDFEKDVAQLLHCPGKVIANSLAGREIQRRGKDVLKEIADHLAQRGEQKVEINRMAAAWAILFNWNHSKFTMIVGVPSKNSCHDTWYRWLCSKATEPIELHEELTEIALE